MKLSKKLQKIVDLANKPFYTSTPDKWSEQDRKEHDEYDNTQEQLIADTKKLKKGDKVIFNYPERIKGKVSGPFRLPSYRDVFHEGTVHQPVKTVKRTRMGEDCSFESIKIASGGFIYPVSLDKVEKI